MAAQPRSSDSGRLLRFTVSLFTITKKEAKFAYLMVLTFPFYAAYTDRKLSLGPFLDFLAVLWCFYSFLRIKNTKVHTSLDRNIPYSRVSKRLVYGVQC